MRSTILDWESILHIHSLRYYLYTLLFITFIHVYDSCFDFMTNDMRVIVEQRFLSITSGCSVSESYFKTKGSDGIQIEWRDYYFIFFWRCEMGCWLSGFDCVLSHCSSLTDIWKVPLGKYSGLNTGAEYRVPWLQMPAGCRIKELHTPASIYTLCPALVWECKFENL